MAVKTYKDYEAFVTRLGSKYTMADDLSKIGTMGLGLAGEAAEISAIMLRYYGISREVEEEDRGKLVNELGDICWYVAFAAANVVNVSFEDLVHKDILTDTDIRPSTGLNFLSLQLSTRCGEVADIVKKLLYHGWPFDDEVKAKVVGKLREIMITVSYLAKDVCRAKLQDCIDKNVVKLSDRYKSLKFTTEEFMQKEKAQTG